MPIDTPNLNTDTNNQTPGIAPTSVPPQPQPQLQPQPKPMEPLKSPVQTGQSFKKPPLMWADSQQILGSIEKKLGGPVVSYYTTGSIVGDDVKYFYTHLKNIGHKEKIFFVLYSSGGDGRSAYRIASLLRSFCDELVIVIPEIAASAATMLALAGDSVVMTPLAYLTAVDTSLTHPLNPKDKSNNPVRVELEEVKRAASTLIKPDNQDKDNLEAYKIMFNYIHPVAFGSMERASNLSEMLCKDILNLRRNPISADEAEKLTVKLNRDYPSHGYPITRKKAREIGIPVVDSDAELDTLLWKYINVNRFLTEPVRTDISDSFFHTETYLNTIESVGRRIAVKQITERRLDPIVKGWTTLRDEFKWEALYEVDENGEKKVMISRLDI
ncbi:hypothetical protein GYA27_04345 [candidate division WWE3 bacterium]|uniref:Serine dehydrogenase proteinase n=1 Tax=candidate division WWE3 bacterium TaxID=2053526 RepID=A0A7X9DLC6_UNCKA|nr:hypothetical protein [candidate division WWE3 bacterium]